MLRWFHAELLLKGLTHICLLVVEDHPVSCQVKSPLLAALELCPILISKNFLMFSELRASPKIGVFFNNTLNIHPPTFDSSTQPNATVSQQLLWIATIISIQLRAVHTTNKKFRTSTTFFGSQVS